MKHVRQYGTGGNCKISEHSTCKGLDIVSRLPAVRVHIATMLFQEVWCDMDCLVEHFMHCSLVVGQLRGQSTAAHQMECLAEPEELQLLSA